MAKRNAANERIKRDYFRLLREARGYDESSIDAVAASIDRFEEYTRRRGFDRFHFEQAIAFKNWLAEQRNTRTGRPLATSTVASTLRALREFFIWLGGQPGFRSRINFGDAAYFRLSDKDTRAASATGDRPVPTIEQIDHVLGLMPAATIFDRRNRALIAFTLLTGARDNAVASLRLRHLDVQGRVVFQDPRAVRTKASKAIRTWFFPVGDLAAQIVCDWVRELRDEHLWGDDDPLFPPTQIGQNLHQQFAPVGLLRSTWSNADPIRKIFGRAFELAGLPYFNPHSFRRTLARLGERLCKTPEEFKAWSQNLGHEQVLTTFSSYGSVPLHRQGEIILSLGADGTGEDADVDELIDKLAARLKKRTV